MNDGDVSVSILNLGCITQDWQVPIGNNRVPVVLGYESPEDYVHNPAYLGAIVGRVANRIGGAQFQLGEETYKLAANVGQNMLHGGPSGLSHRIWDMEGDASSVELHLTSPDGDQGFPGRADFCVKISLSGNELTYEMSAQVDRTTPINLAQHSYYNLMGGGDIWNHGVLIAGDRITPLNAEMIVTGELQPTKATRFDFSSPEFLGEIDPQREGYDINYALNKAPVAARVTAPNGLCLELETDQPGLQFYTAQYLEQTHPSLSGQKHGPFAGLCLEAQQFPNAVNIPSFGNTFVTPDAPYFQRLVVRIFEENRE